MTNDELAAEIERLWKAEQQARAAYATLYRRLHWNGGTHAEYDELGRLRSADVVARGRASALMVKRIDAILAALRTPAAAVGDDAVERVAEAEQPPNDGSVHRDDPMEDLRQAARMIRTWIPDVYPTNEAGQVPFARALMESVADAIESALAAMPGSGMADAALRAVMGLNSVQTLFEAAEEYPHGEEDVAAELAALKLARAAMARGTGNG